ncbi:MAG: 1,6-anhydro-N-acetylmuramyl-L-alanine amidase AmpD [Pseudomonadales bacterium]
MSRVEQLANENRGPVSWLPGLRKCYSPNFDQRPEGSDLELLVLHNISLPPEKFGTQCIEAFFCNCLNVDADPYFRTISDLKVSAHFLIDRQGQASQFVSIAERAWHAGVSNYLGRERCNDFSIGIEMEGADLIPYTQAQYQAVAMLCATLIKSNPTLSASGIVGHSDIAPGRKTDPGEAFEWLYFNELLAACLADKEQ